VVALAHFVGEVVDLAACVAENDGLMIVSVILCRFKEEREENEDIPE
jgi:hypothetical protein